MERRQRRQRLTTTPTSCITYTRRFLLLLLLLPSSSSSSHIHILLLSLQFGVCFLTLSVASPNIRLLFQVIKIYYVYTHICDENSNLAKSARFKSVHFWSLTEQQAKKNTHILSYGRERVYRQIFIGGLSAAQHTHDTHSGRAKTKQEINNSNNNPVNRLCLGDLRLREKRGYSRSHES